MNRTLTALFVSVSLALPLVVRAAGAVPDATIELYGKTVAVGVGFTEAKGTLQYKGKSYPLEMRGVSLAQAGAANLKATGEVFNLNRVEDLNGSYASAGAGAAVGDGHSEATMKNEHGVVMKLHGKTDGVDLRLSVDGVWVKLTQ